MSLNMERFSKTVGSLAAVGLLLPGQAAAQSFCPDHPGNPVLLTPGTASCLHDALSGDTSFTLTDPTIIQWDALNVPDGSTMNFDFLPGAYNHVVLNMIVGSGTNTVDGSIVSNGHVVITKPSGDFRVNGSIVAESFTGVSLSPDDPGEILSGDPTSYGAAGGGGRFSVRDGGKIEAMSGDIVLGGISVQVQGTGRVEAHGGAVRMVRATQFSIGGTTPERITEGGPEGGLPVQITGEVRGNTVEIKSTSNINNGGTVTAAGGVGQIFLRVGSTGTIFNEGTGTLNGVLQITGDYDSVGIEIGPKENDTAVALTNSTSELPALEDPRGRRIEAQQRSQMGTAAGSVAVQRRQQANGRRAGAGTLASTRAALNRKSAFFGVVARGRGEKKE